MLLTISALACSALPMPAQTPKAETTFALQVLPVLQAKCFACHGEDAKKLKGGLDLTSRANLLQGGDSGKPAIVAAMPAQSPLYRAVLRNDADYKPMPPKEKDALTADEIAAIKSWIEGGAPWPDAARIAEITRAQKA